MADWIWNASVEKNRSQLTIDILQKKVLPSELQIPPIIAYLDALKETISKTCVSAGFDPNLIVEAKFEISISQRYKIHRLLLIEAVLKDRDGKIYKSKKYEEQAYEQKFVFKSTPIGSSKLFDKIKRLFRY